MAFGGTKDKIPSGWVACDGRVLSRTEFQGLYEVIGTAWGAGNSSSTFHIPDMRGMFLRGVDEGANIDEDKNNRASLSSGGNTNNNVGSYQGETYKAHNHGGRTGTAGKHKHKIMNGNNVLTFGDREGWSTRFLNQGEVDAGAELSTDNIGDHTHTISNDGGNETRPDNVYVYYIIKL